MGSHCSTVTDGRYSGRRRGTGRHRRRIAPYAWLGAGAFTLGVGTRS